MDEIRTYKFLQVNGQGSRLVNQELRKLIVDMEIDVLCIQEPYAYRSKITEFPNTVQIIANAKNPKSAIINLNKNIVMVEITQFTDEWVTCVELLTESGKIIIVNVYCQFCLEIDQFLIKIENIIQSFPGYKILLSMDANAKSPMWHSNVATATARDRRRGELLEDLIMTRNLIIQNTEGEPSTYKNSAGAETNIDVTLTTSNLSRQITSWKVHDGLTCSDHNVITFDLIMTKPNIWQMEEDVAYKLTYNVNRINKERFNKKLILPQIQRGANLDELANDIENKVIEAIKYSSPKATQTKKRILAPFWCDELTRKKRITRAKRKSYQRTRDPDLRRRKLEEFRQAKTEYKELILARKTETWEKFVYNNLQLDPWGKPYKLCMAKVNAANISTLQRNDGTITSNWEETAALLMEELVPLDTNDNESDQQKRLREKNGKYRKRSWRTGISSGNK